MKITLVYLTGNQLWTGTETVKRGEPFDADLDWFCAQSKLIRSRLGVVVDGVIHPPVERVPADPKAQWDSIQTVWTAPKEDDSKPDKTEPSVPQKDEETEPSVPQKKRRRGSK